MLLHLHLLGHSSHRIRTLARHDDKGLVRLLVLRLAASAAAEVGLDSGPEEAMLALPVCSGAERATLLELEAEVALPDQHRQPNQDRGWVAEEGSNKPVANSLGIHMPLLD